MHKEWRGQKEDEIEGGWGKETKSSLELKPGK